MTKTEFAILVGGSFLVLAASLALTFYVKFLKRELNRIGNAAKWREKFFAAAEVLSRDDETPVDILEFLMRTSRVIDNPRTAQNFLSNFRSATESPQGNDFAGVDWLIANRKELLPALLEVIQSWILAVSYLDSKYGPTVREYFEDYMVERNERARQDVVVAKTIQTTTKETRLDHDCLAAA